MFEKCNSFEGECQLLRAASRESLGSGKEELEGEKDYSKGDTSPTVGMGFIFKSSSGTGRVALAYHA